MTKRNQQPYAYSQIFRVFLAGIMYMLLVNYINFFRDTDFLKQEKRWKSVASNLSGEDLGKTLKIKKFKAEREEGDVVYFKGL
jgi:hypothetical protein